MLFSLPGGWWSVSGFGEISGTVAIEMQNNSYIHALDTGLFTVGAPHKGECIYTKVSSGQAKAILFILHQITAEVI